MSTMLTIDEIYNLINENQTKINQLKLELCDDNSNIALFHADIIDLQMEINKINEEKQMKHEEELKKLRFKRIPCKYETRCNNPNCNFSHSVQDIRAATNEVLPKNYKTIKCRYGDTCIKGSLLCPFIHDDEI